MKHKTMIVCNSQSSQLLPQRQIRVWHFSFTRVGWKRRCRETLYSIRLSLDIFSEYYYQIFENGYSLELVMLKTNPGS
jgi:hypothetical protein